MRVIDLSILNYHDAWAKQEQFHVQVLAGEEEAILLVEHTPVITFGRRAQDSAKHLVASREMLEMMGVDLVESDRGGDITFHGPGQLVVYPIVRLADYRLSVGGYVKALQQAVVETLGQFGIGAHLDPEAIGIWTDTGKICALGVRIKRGVSMHGIALNVTINLNWFNLIVPCGLAGKPVTSVRQIMGDQSPSIDAIKPVLAEKITACVQQNLRNNAHA